MERKHSTELNELNKNLDIKVKERRAEISSVLAGSNQAFFAFDNTGKIILPISEFSKELFRQEIQGQKLSNILYPNLKPGMKEFEDLRQNY
jgi:hypothetical protein